MLVRKSVGYTLARGLPGLVTFAALAIYSRLLTPADYGLYTLAQFSVLFADSIFCNWLGVSLVRFSQRGRSADYNALISNVRTVFAAITLSIAVAGFFVARHLNLTAPSWIMALIVSVLLISEPWHNMNLKLAIAQLDTFRYGKIASIRSLASLAAGGSLAALGFGAAGALTGLAIGSVLSSLWPSVVRRWNVGSHKLQPALVKEVASYGLPLALTFALTFVVGYSDRYLLALLSDRTSVGHYAAGYDLATLAMAVLTTINMAAYPLVVRILEKEGDTAAQRQLEKNLQLFLLAAVPILILVTIYARGLIDIVIGAQFREAALGVTPIVGPAVLLAALRSYHLDVSFHLRRRTWPILIIVASAALTNVALNAIWIPKYGIYGAAWSTLAAYALAFAISLVLGRKLGFRLPGIDKQALFIILAGAGTFLLCMQITLPGIVGFALQCSAMVVSYTLLLLVFRVDLAHRTLHLIFDRVSTVRRSAFTSPSRSPK